MNIGEALKSAIKQLMSSKIRTTLTMTGMFIGVGAVIMILALGAGLTDNMMDSFSEAGLNVFRISVKQPQSDNYITSEDLELLKTLPEVECIAATNQGRGNVMNKEGDLYRCSITGAQPLYNTKIYKKTILYGRHLNEKDEKAQKASVLISENVARALFKNKKDLSAVIGQSLEITINNQPLSFEVVGIYDGKEGSNLSPKELEKIITASTYFVPFTTLNHLLGLNGKIEEVGGLTVEGYDQIQVTTQIGQILNRRHHLMDGYQIDTFAMIVDMSKQVMSVITLFISAIASISLVVGGVGIMNIMLVTVKERTREIGVRKALGAPNTAILGQFLIEALILTVIAGGVGMLLGYLGAVMIGEIMGVKASFSIGMLLFSSITSVAIGILFGVYPAYQASKLDPIEALRAD